MKPTHETAAICGLFCGTCPSYPEECRGCLSSHVAPGCAACGNGFRACAAEHAVLRCYECPEFPCARLEEFSKRHIVNGICHHEHVIEDLRNMKEMGVTAWVAQQTNVHTCNTCGKLTPWYEPSCSWCIPKE